MRGSSTRTLAILAALLGLAACGRAPGNANGGRHPWTIPGVVRLGEVAEPDSLNPMFGHTEATDIAGGLLFSYLLRYDDAGNYIPDLATAVPTLANGGIAADGKTIVLHLRKGARWSDGAPLTARDWLFTYAAVKNPANNTKTAYGWDDIASASAPDDATLIVHLKRPNAAMLGLFAMGGSAYPPLPAHLLARLPNINTAPFNRAPISSSPYVLKAWGPRQRPHVRTQPVILSRPSEAARNRLESDSRRQHVVYPAANARDRRVSDGR